MKFWIVVYHHCYGDDAWPVWSDTAPSLDDEAASLDDWEGGERDPETGDWINGRDDEYLSLCGPFTVPTN